MTHLHILCEFSSFFEFHRRAPGLKGSLGNQLNQHVHRRLPLIFEGKRDQTLKFIKFISINQIRQCLNYHWYCFFLPPFCWWCQLGMLPSGPGCIPVQTFRTISFPEFVSTPGPTRTLHSPLSLQQTQLPFKFYAPMLFYVQPSNMPALGLITCWAKVARKDTQWLEWPQWWAQHFHTVYSKASWNSLVVSEGKGHI